MRSDLADQTLLATVILFVMALTLALMLCILLGGKTFRTRILILILIGLICWPLNEVQSVIAFNYYEILSTSALFSFLFPTFALSMAISSWMEWKSPPLQWKDRSYRERSIAMGIAASLGSIGLVFFMLPQTTMFISDIVTGPSAKTGIIETVRLNASSRGVIFGGEFQVEGTLYRTSNLGWYYTLSPGQTIEFAYSPATHLGFPSDQMVRAPLGVIFPVGVVGVGLLVFIGILKVEAWLRQRPIEQRQGIKRAQTQELIRRMSSQDQTSRSGFFLLLLIVSLLLFFALILFILPVPK